MIALAMSGALSLADLQGLEGAARARALLPPAVAARVVGGTVSRTERSGRGWIAKFWEAPRAVGPAACERTVHAVRTVAEGVAAGQAPARTAAMKAEPLDSYPQITTTMGVAASPAVRPDDMAAGRMLLARLAGDGAAPSQVELVHAETTLGA